MKITTHQRITQLRQLLKCGNPRLQLHAACELARVEQAQTLRKLTERSLDVPSKPGEVK
jgi:hypothetical protein